MIAARHASSIEAMRDADVRGDSVIVGSGSAGSSAPLIADPPDRAAAVFGHEQRAIIRHGNADGATPHLRVGDHKPRHEILIFACGFPRAVEQQSNDLVSRPFVPVPGPVHRRKSTALVFGGKVATLVEGYLQGR